MSSGRPPTDVDRVMPYVTIVRSAKRRRTSSAQLRQGRVVVRVPAAMTAADEGVAVERLVARLVARADAELLDVPLPASVAVRATRDRRGPRGDVALVARADTVADRWLPGVRAASVDWSQRMTTRWASCTTTQGRIATSARLADAPDEVLDNVLLHELAHLLEPNHGAAFHGLVRRDDNHEVVVAWLARRSHLELRAALGLA